MSAVLHIGRLWPNQPDDDPQRAYRMWCPGCDRSHRVIDGPNGWTWDGNEDTPTFSPSILVRWQRVAGQPERCHSFIRGGVWEFLDDCTHALAGRRVPMVPHPLNSKEDQ